MRAGLAWPWADVERQYQLAKSPLGAKGKGWKMERREMFLLTSQKHKDSRRKKLPGEQGLGEGESLLCAHGRTQERTQVPYGEWGVSDIFMAVKSVPGKSFFSEFASPKMPFVPTHDFFPNWFLSPAESLWKKF